MGKTGSGGVTGQRQEYFDDSSAALSLSRRADTAPDAEVFDRGGDRLPKPSKLRDIEIEQRQRIVEVEREVRDREIAKLQRDHGMTAKQAAETYDRERRTHGKERKALEREERKRKELEHLTDAHKKPAKHSGSKSGRRFGGKKRGTLVCDSDGCRQECKWCECIDCNCPPCKQYRDGRGKGGRPPTSNRSLESHIRYSPMTAAAMAAAKIKPSDAVEVFAIAWQDGISIEAAAQEFRSRKGVGRASAA